MKNYFYFMLKALLVLELSYVEKRFEKKAKVNCKIYDVADWTKLITIHISLNIFKTKGQSINRSNNNI